MDFQRYVPKRVHKLFENNQLTMEQLLSTVTNSKMNKDDVLITIIIPVSWEVK